MRHRAARRLGRALLLTLLALLIPAGAGAQGVDTLLLDGKVVTLDRASSVHEALAVRDGTIVAVGRRPISARSPAPARG